MARQQPLDDEIPEARKREAWSLKGPSRIVKILQIGPSRPRALHGYVCQEKVLLGRTPFEIERNLGLKLGYLQSGCGVYALQRLPLTCEYEYELTTAQPGGLAFDSVISNPDYAPGHPFIHQWRLLVDIPAFHLLDLLPGKRYPYLHV